MLAEQASEKINFIDELMKDTNSDDEDLLSEVQLGHRVSELQQDPSVIQDYEEDYNTNNRTDLDILRHLNPSTTTHQQHEEKFSKAHQLLSQLREDDEQQEKRRA